jgi:hypothetical protein
MLKYTAASGRLNHATFWEWADASVRCTELGVKLYLHMSDEALAGYLYIIYVKMFLDDNQRCTRRAVGIRTI